MLKKMMLVYALFIFGNTLIGMEENAIQEKNNNLLAAAADGNYTLWEQLIWTTSKECINCSDNNGNTSLHLAKDFSTLKTVVQYSALMLTQKNKYGETPLLYQLYPKKSYEDSQEEYDRYQKINCLLLFGANPNDRIETTGRTALHIACMHKQGNVVQLLLEKGADPAVCSKSGILPIEFLTSRYTDIIKLFAPYGYTMLTHDLCELLVNDAACLKELVEAYKVRQKIQNLLYHLFIVLHEQQDLDESKKQLEMHKQNSKFGVICRYPSYALLESLFGVDALACARETLKTTVIGLHLLKIDKEQGRAALLEEMQLSLPVSHNNTDLFVSTPEENKEYFVYMLRSHKYWSDKLLEFTLSVSLGIDIDPETD